MVDPASETPQPSFQGFDAAIIINGLGALYNPNRQAKINPDNPYALDLDTVDLRAISDARASGLTALNQTLGHIVGGGDPLEATVADIGRWDALIARQAELRKVLRGEDFAVAKSAGQIGIIYGLQNTTALGDDLDRVALLHRLGVRIVQLTYNNRNAVGDGATVADDQGLSRFGVAAMEQLQAEGMLVDLSHSSERTCLAALECARKPMVISHTGCRALVNHPRNKTDDELRRLADAGGVVGIYGMPYLRLSGQPYAADFLFHLEHAIAVCGEDHVGIGTDGTTTVLDDTADYQRGLAADISNRRALGIGAPGEAADVVLFLPDLTGPDQFRCLADMLAKRGHGAGRIEKILGGNFARTMAEAWG